MDISSDKKNADHSEFTLLNIAKTFGILLWVTDLHVTMLSAYNNAELCLAVQKALIFLKEKFKVVQYAK